MCIFVFWHGALPCKILSQYLEQLPLPKQRLIEFKMARVRHVGFLQKVICICMPQCRLLLFINFGADI